VIAIVCGKKADALAVQSRLIEHWGAFSQLFRATCAPYVTMSSLEAFLDSHGISVEKPAGYGEDMDWQIRRSAAVEAVSSVAKRSAGAIQSFLISGIHLGAAIPRSMWKYVLGYRCE